MTFQAADPRSLDGRRHPLASDHEIVVVFKHNCYGRSGLEDEIPRTLRSNARLAEKLDAIQDATGVP